MSSKQYRVRAARCDHRAPDDEIYEILTGILDDLPKSLERIHQARRIVIKANIGWPVERMRYFEGRRQELVDDAVMRAALRYLRANTNARLTLLDTFPNGGRDLEMNFQHIIDEFDLEFIDASDGPIVDFAVPGGGNMFKRYALHECVGEADAIVSIAKAKNHGFMGVTMSCKNLFGLPPIPPRNVNIVSRVRELVGSAQADQPGLIRQRSYFHHLVRLPYVLADLGMICKPDLNIIDALVGQSVREWGGEPRVCDTLIAGDNTIATDACCAHLMGVNPADDWPMPPFRRDRNHLMIAAENGYGTIDLDEIDFNSEVTAPIAEFDSEKTDPAERVHSWRKTMCRQALYFRDNMDEFISGYADQFILLQDGEVIGSNSGKSRLPSRRTLAGDKPDEAIWLKYVDPDEYEGECFQVYEDVLRRLE